MARNTDSIPSKEFLRHMVKGFRFYRADATVPFRAHWITIGTTSTYGIICLN